MVESEARKNDPRTAESTRSIDGALPATTDNSPAAWLHKPLFAELAIVICGLLAYSNSLHGPFVYDDVCDIKENRLLQEAQPFWRAVVDPDKSGLILHHRPIVVLTFAVNYALTGLNVVYFHATNVLVHLLAGLTLYGIVRRTLLLASMRSFHSAANPLALVIALLWTLHPLQTGAVTYIVQRYESLMGLFYLMTLYAAIRVATSERLRAGWSIICVLACLLAMGCKEVAISAPLIVLLYDRAFVSGSFRAAWRDRKALYLGLAATWLIVLPFLWERAGGGGVVATSQGFAGFSENKPWNVYALNQPAVILHYLRLCFWPQGQCLDYAWRASVDPLQIGPPLVVIGALLAITALWTVRQPIWGFVGDWFFLILAPSSSIVPVNDLAFEHRMYLPLAAVVAATVLGCYRLIHRQWPRSYVVAKRLCYGLSIAGVATLAVLTFCRNRVYADSMTAWEDVLAKSPDNPRAMFTLAGLLADQGRAPEALAYLLALEQDDSAMLQNADVQSVWGARLINFNQGEKAIPHLLEALRLDPDLIEARVNLAALLAFRGYPEAAYAEYQNLRRLQPSLATDQAASADEKTQQMARLVKYVASVCQVEPAKASERPMNRALAAYEMGVALTRAEKPQTALVYFAAAEKLEPDAALAGALREAIEAATRQSSEKK
jgi:tetratricopeptide (TPR) repeat protein